MTQQQFTTAEVAALVGLDSERVVRKEVEHGLIEAGNPPRMDWPVVAYFAVLSELGLELGVDDRRRLLKAVRRAVARHLAEVDLSRVVRLEVGQVLSELESRINRFLGWKDGLTVSADILGGEPAFPRSRLAVRRVAALLERGVSADEIREDYPYLTMDDIAFARIFARAYPHVGRPRKSEAAT
jgi:uncharacterized protein (DUF433 family)